jgi:hypothetical protein
MERQLGPETLPSTATALGAFDKLLRICLRFSEKTPLNRLVDETSISRNF